MFMMEQIAKWFTGLTFVIISIKENSALGGVGNTTEPDDSNTECSVQVVGEKDLHADCSSRNLLKVPNNLNKDIVYLDISNNLDLELHDDDLMRYSDLKTLKMMYINKFSKISKKFFSPLSQIEVLDMSGVKIINDGSILPPSVVDFYINNSNLTSFDLSHLENLTKLHMARNRLINFPYVSENAPLTYVDLRYNPLNELTYESIAPFCQLKNLGLELPGSSTLSTPNKYKECCMLRSWITAYNISGATNGLKCSSSDRDEKCETNFNMDAVKKYNECLEKSATDGNSSLWATLFNVILGVILISAISFLLYRFVYKAQMKAEEKRQDPAVRRESEIVDREAEDADNDAT